MDMDKDKQPCAIEREGEIISQIGRQASANAILHEAVDDLGLKLTNVLAPQTPVEEKDEAEVDNPASFVTKELKGSTEAVKDATYRIRCLIDRIEL